MRTGARDSLETQSGLRLDRSDSTPKRWLLDVALAFKATERPSLKE